MEINLFQYLIILLISILGSAVQTVTGFGMAIIVMLVFPIYFPMVEATALAGIICLCNNLTVAIRLRKSVKWSRLWVPTIVFVVVNYIFVVIATRIDVTALKAYFGLFLVLLSFYFIFLSGRIHIKGNHLTGAVSAAASGVTGGLFGVGGPLVVPYFLAVAGDDKNVYLATIQMCFLFQNISGIAGRAVNGAVTGEILIAAIPGVIGMFLGSIIGKVIVGRVNVKQLTTIVYGFMTVAGIIVFITSI